MSASEMGKANLLTLVERLAYTSASVAATMPMVRAAHRAQESPNPVEFEDLVADPSVLKGIARTAIENECFMHGTQMDYIQLVAAGDVASDFRDLYERILTEKMGQEK